MKTDVRPRQAWFITGSQHLYGDEALRQVAENSGRVVEALNASGNLPVSLVCQPVVTSPESILQICQEANADPSCLGLVCWMHTFSPAKMWIAGLSRLRKPLAHLHTQFNRDIPWSTIDMDFMNLNQSAHGGREFGYICTRMRKPRKVIVGHFQDVAVQQRLADWMRAAAGWIELQSLKIARFGDNMRQVAVTEGEKVDAQMQLGIEVNGFGMGDLAQRIDGATDADVDRLVAQYDELYAMVESLRASGPRRSELRDAARIELGLRAFLEEGSFQAFTDTFENLHGLQQLPGLAVQRLMADGYGFGAEGDWKHAALVRVLKVMAAGLPGGTSFMEDYTYHFDPRGPRVLGAHMLEICPSLAAQQPSCEIHPLGIGGKRDPVRLVFDSQTGPAVNASLVDLGDRLRLVVNQLDVVAPDEPLPRLPVARALWVPQPDLETAAAAWIYAGGAHHTAFSLAVTAQQLEDLAEIADIELLLIDQRTRLTDFKKELRWNDVAWR